MESSKAKKPWRIDSNGCLNISFHVQPNAKKSEMKNVKEGAFWVRIAAPALDSKANLALIAFAAIYFNISKSNIKLIMGEKSRNKVLQIEANDFLLARLESLT